MRSCVHAYIHVYLMYISEYTHTHTRTHAHTHTHTHTPVYNMISYIFFRLSWRVHTWNTKQSKCRYNWYKLTNHILGWNVCSNGNVVAFVWECLHSIIAWLVHRMIPCWCHVIHSTVAGYFVGDLVDWVCWHSNHADKLLASISGYGSPDRNRENYWTLVTWFHILS